MEKKKKISIISAIVAFVLVAGGLLTYFILPKNDNKQLKTLLSNVSQQIFDSYENLANSFNEESGTQAVSYNTSMAFSFGENPASGENETINEEQTDGDENEDDCWLLTQGNDTFQDYLDNINNVMAHFAIAEYLVENKKTLDFSKTYYFKSSTVEYYATAQYNKNIDFTFTVRNSNEKISVRVNIAKDDKCGKSIEFFRESKLENNKYCYQYSILNLEVSTYDEIIVTTNNQYNGSFNNDWVNNNVEQHHQHNIDHHDRDSYVGKKYVRNGNPANQHGDPRSNDIYNNIYDHKDKLFNHFDDDKYNKNNTTKFPNAQGMQDYAFSKYVASIVTDENDKQVLLITRNSEEISKEELFNSSDFTSDTEYSWEYKSDFKVVSQVYCNKWLGNETRKITLADYDTSNGNKFEVVCKKDGKYYKFSFGGKTTQTTISSSTSTHITISYGIKSAGFSLSYDTIIKFGYNKLEDGSIEDSKLNTQNEKILSNSSEIQPLQCSYDTINSLNLTETGLYEIVAYYTRNQKTYRTHMYFKAETDTEQIESHF